MSGYGNYEPQQGQQQFAPQQDPGFQQQGQYAPQQTNITIHQQYQPAGPTQITVVGDPRFWISIINTISLISFPSVVFNAENVSAGFVFWTILYIIILATQTAIGYAAAFNVYGLRDYITEYRTEVPTFKPSQNPFQLIRFLVQIIPGIANALCVIIIIFFCIFAIFITPNADGAEGILFIYIVLLFILAAIMAVPCFLSLSSSRMEFRSLQQVSTYFAFKNGNQVNTGYGGQPQQQSQYMAPQQPMNNGQYQQFNDQENPSQPFIQPQQPPQQH